MPNESIESRLPKKLTAGQYALETIGAYGAPIAASKLVDRFVTPPVVAATQKLITGVGKGHNITRGILASAPSMAATVAAPLIERNVRARLANANVEDMKSEQRAAAKNILSWALPTMIVGSVPKMLEVGGAISKERAALPAVAGQAAIAGSAIIGDYLARSKARAELRRKLRAQMMQESGVKAASVVDYNRLLCSIKECL